MKDWTKILASANLVNCFIGYEFVVTLFSSIIRGFGETQLITVPYRGLSMLLAFIILWRSRNKHVQLPMGVWCILLYWGILVARFIYDVMLDNDLRFAPGEVQKTTLMIFGVNIPTLLAVLKSWGEIDFKRVYKWMLYLTLMASVAAVLFNKDKFAADASDLINGRLAIKAVNPITLGHLGSLLVILGLFVNKLTLPRCLRLGIKISAILLGLLLVSKAASRGPLLMLTLSLSLYFYYKTPQYKKFIIITSCLTLIFWPLAEGLFLDILQWWAPSLHNRVVETIEMGDSGRSELASEAWTLFKNSPAYGSQFCLYNAHKFYYSHNLILDSLVSGGLIGFIIFIIPLVLSIVSIPRLMAHGVNTFFVLVCFKQIGAAFLSGTFYMQGAIGVAICSLLLMASSLKRLKKSKCIPSPIKD